MFRWDDIAFDGPKLAPLRSIDALDVWREQPRFDEGIEVAAVQTSVELSPGSAKRVEFPDVDVTDAARATLNLNHDAAHGQTLRYRVNAGDWTEFTVPEVGPANYPLRSLSLPIEVAALRNGVNTIDFDGEDPVGNIDISIETE